MCCFFNFECLLLKRMVVFHMRHSPEKYLPILPLRCTLACKSCIRDRSAVHQSQERRCDRWKERAGAQPHASKSPSFNDRGTELVQRYSSSNSQGFKGHMASGLLLWLPTAQADPSELEP